MDLRELVIAEARARGVSPELALAVMQQESGGRVNAVSRKGARGPMQLMPETARELGVNIDDPADNIRGGVEYLSRQLAAFNGDPRLALAAYNAGPGAVRRAGGVPNFPETQAYVSAVQARTGRGDDSDIFVDQRPEGRSDNNVVRAAGTADRRTSGADDDIFADVQARPAPAAPRSTQPASSGVVNDAVDGAVNLGRGLVRGGRDLVDSGAYLVPKGLSYVTSLGGLASNPVSQFFDSEAKRVSDINRQAETDYQRATDGSVMAGIGRVGGNVATSFVPGLGQTAAAQKANAAWQAGHRFESLGRAAALGAGQGIAYNTRTENDSVIGNAAGGAIGGAVGQAVIGGIVNPLVRGVRNAVADDAERAGRVVLRAAHDPAALERTLRAGGGEIVPGAAPTVPQLAQDAGISQLYRTAKNTGARGLVEREAAQNAARMGALDRLSAPGQTAIEAAESAGNTIRAEVAPLRKLLKDVIRGAYNVPELQGIHLTPPKAEVIAIGREMYPGGIRMPAELDDTLAALSSGVPRSFPELQSLRSFASKKAYSLAQSDPTQAAAFAKVRDLIDDLPDRAVNAGTLDAASSTAFEQAKHLRRTLGERFESGAAKAMWERGSDNLPKKQGAEVARAFFNASPSQRADIDQFMKMSPNNPVTREALRDYAIADLREKATNAGGLSSKKFGDWTNRRAESLRGLLSSEERDTLNAINRDLFRADRAEALGMARGSPTAQNLLSAGLLDSPGVRTALRYMPIVNRVATPLLDTLADRSRATTAQAVTDLLLDPTAAAQAIVAARASSQVPLGWNPYAAGLLGAGVPLTSGLRSLLGE